MIPRLPEPLEQLVERLRKLPGLGPKSALRAAMTLLAWPEEAARGLGESITRLRDELCLCSRCGGITSSDPCPICADPARDNSILCIVPEWDSMLSFEDGKFYHGRYLILGGLLEPLQNRDSAGLNLDLLDKRLAEGEIKEVILGLGATVEAENTVSFLKEYIRKRYPDINLTRLGQGIPLGGLVKFMDKETLRQALEYRRDV